MNGPNFVTYGDSNYFGIMEINIKQINKLYPNSKIFVGDVGLTTEERKRIKKLKNVVIIDLDKIRELRQYFYNPKRAFYEKLFKLRKYKCARFFLNRFFPMKCISDIIYKHLISVKPLVIIKSVLISDETPLIFMDGDTILINKIDELLSGNFDIGVTVRSKEDQKTCGKYGKINAGVIILKCKNNRKINFLTDWLRKMLIEYANEVSLAEQDALNKIIYGKYLDKTNLKFKEFDGEIYNYSKVEKGFDRSKNKVLHLKSGRFKDKELIEKIKKEIYNDKL